MLKVGSVVLGFGAMLLLVALAEANPYLVVGDVATLDDLGSPSSTGEIHAYYHGQWDSNDIPSKYDRVSVALVIDGSPVRPVDHGFDTYVQTTGFPGTIINADWHIPVGPGTYYSASGHHTVDFWITLGLTSPVPQSSTHIHLHDEWDQP